MGVDRDNGVGTDVDRGVDTRGGNAGRPGQAVGANGDDAGAGDRLVGNKVAGGDRNGTIDGHRADRALKGHTGGSGEGTVNRVGAAEVDHRGSLGQHGATDGDVGGGRRGRLDDRRAIDLQGVGVVQLKRVEREQDLEAAVKLDRGGRVLKVDVRVDREGARAGKDGAIVDGRNAGQANLVAARNREGGGTSGAGTPRQGSKVDINVGNQRDRRGNGDGGGKSGTSARSVGTNHKRGATAFPGRGSQPVNRGGQRVGCGGCFQRVLGRHRGGKRQEAEKGNRNVHSGNLKSCVFVVPM